MAADDRDETGWATAIAAPAALADLERRIEEAEATARASEAAIMTVGAAAFDAAEQAHRAAELAERASSALLAERLQPPALPPPGSLLPPEPAIGEIRVSAIAPPNTGFEDESLRAFNLRADRLSSRLRALV